MDIEGSHCRASHKINADRFRVSLTCGFLLDNPVQKLPKYFEQWHVLATKMPEQVALHRFRQEVEQMPILDHARLSGYKELRLAHLQLSVIGSGYVWQDGDKGVPNKLPACISLPWCAVSDILGIQPILSHPSMVLANWRLRNTDKPISIENMVSLYQLPGGDEADWFVVATAGVELSFVYVIQPLLDAVKFAGCEDENRLTQSLESMTNGLRKMLDALKKIHDGIKAETFYNVLRPFLAGWGGDGSPLPEGLVYEGVDDVPKKMMGGSAAQSSILQSIDAALGVQHEPDKREFMLTSRQYMPGAHREFIEELERLSSIKTFVRGCSNEKLKMFYNDCLVALMAFRSYHIQIVTKYIVVVSRQTNRNQEYASLDAKGTGGSSLVPFLKGIRDTTDEQKVDL